MEIRASIHDSWFIKDKRARAWNFDDRSITMYNFKGLIVLINAIIVIQNSRILERIIRSITFYYTVKWYFPLYKYIIFLYINMPYFYTFISQLTIALSKVINILIYRFKQIGIRNLIFLISRSKIPRIECA